MTPPALQIREGIR